MNDEFNNDMENEESTFEKIKEWAQENIRIIVSVLIVFLIASSIYSYSKRGEESVEMAEKSSDIEEILNDLSSADTEAEVSESAATDESATDMEEGTDAATTQEEATPAPQQIASAQETENSFIESAQAGDGTTHLARRALAHYLEKNADSSLTNEHKIYIEDYLRKNVGFQGSVHIGTSVEFSKSLIQEAIAASKNLNDSQLKNLQKYSQNVQF